jgi:acylpyruvate hydrolase
MRLMTFETPSGPRFGLVNGDAVIDVNSADTRYPADISAFLRMGGTRDDLKSLASTATSGATMPLAGLTHGLPLRSPSKIFCLGLNYLEHVKEGPYQVPDYPTIFMRGATSLVAHNQPIIRPMISDKLDFEAELVVVIGKRTRHASLESALDSIFAY